VGGLPESWHPRRHQFTPECGKNTNRSFGLVPVAAGDVFADEQRQRLIGRLSPSIWDLRPEVSELNCVTAGLGKRVGPWRRNWR